MAAEFAGLRSGMDGQLVSSLAEGPPPQERDRKMARSTERRLALEVQPALGVPGVAVGSGTDHVAPEFLGRSPLDFRSFLFFPLLFFKKVTGAEFSNAIEGCKAIRKLKCEIPRKTRRRIGAA